MPRSKVVSRPLNEEIDELNARMNLLLGDQKAYKESSVQAKEECKRQINDLRRENNRLRLQLRDRLSADDHVINQAFQNKPIERAMLANKPIRLAIETMDYKVCDGIKKLNAMQHMNAQKQKRLEEIEYHYSSLCKDTEEVQATLEGFSKEGQHLRDLENRLDKAMLKCHEADHIKKTYERIKSKLEEEHLNYGNNLDAMESEIKWCREEIKELKAMHADAVLARDAALEELHKQEELVYTERRRRDVELNNMKQVALDKQLLQEKIEKRIAARESSNIQDDGRTQAIVISEEQQKRIADFEEAFKIIKEATGVSDLDEVVMRFENQGDTKKHLEELKKSAERTITKLKEEKERLGNQYAEMKYTGESKMSNGQRVLEEYKDKVDEEENRRTSVNKELELSSEVLVKCKSGIEHLHDKLRHIKVSKSTAPQVQIDMSSDEFVLDMLSRCEEKLLQLLEQLGQINIDEEIIRMHEEDNRKELLLFLEFQNQIESKIPEHNTRIILPTVPKENVYEDEEESGDDNDSVLTRVQIKKKSEQLVESKTKKRNPRKKSKKSKGK